MRHFGFEIRTANEVQKQFACGSIQSEWRHRLSPQFHEALAMTVYRTTITSYGAVSSI